MRRVLSILMENEPGALSRVSNLFSARAYNIESLNVAPTEEPTLSRMTVVTYGDEGAIEQITKQVNKLIEVFKVIDITDKSHVESELMLAKIRAEGKTHKAVKDLADSFDGKIINITSKTYIVQVAGDKNKLDSFLAAVGGDDILETARTGACGLPSDKDD